VFEEPKKRRWPKVVATLFFLAVLGGGIFAWRLMYKPNVPAELSEEIIQIPTGSDFDAVVALLREGGYLIDESSFRLMAEQMSYSGRPGRFRIQPNWTNRKLIRHLRSGKQEPVNVILVNERLPEHVAGKVARFIESDSASLIRLFNDSAYLDSIGYSKETLMSLFIPNTYQFFWNTTPRGFVERMVKEHDRFWSKDDRQAKADKLNLSREEVYTLASIVGRETNANVEKPRVAGLYYNRIKKGMLLQADPTLVFVSKDWESRSLAKYKTLDSPYNTYMYPGLPPGPISMANIQSIDAVLNHEKHDYIFMCAKGDGSGLHNFSKTLSGHNVNIRTYVRNLRKRGL
jgi:UPF0755 protein